MRSTPLRRWAPLLLVLVGLVLPGLTGCQKKPIGTMTVGGVQTPLLYGYATDAGTKRLHVILTSKEVPPDVAHLIGDDEARQRKLHAVVFYVSKAERKVETGAVFFQGEKESGFRAFWGETAPTLELKRFDANVIEGRIVSTSANSASGYSFDASFSLPIGGTK